MHVSEFLRVYPMRAPQIMWFLGAGASFAANIPTAGTMIWDFKRRLYCTEKRVPLATCQDLSDPVLQARLQDYCDGTGLYPPPGGDDEYAAYFEAVYPREDLRRRYIQEKVSGGTPSHGHLVLAALLKLQRARVIWTTNFDRVVEDAAAKILGSSGQLVVATPDTPQLAREALLEERGPLYVKLHGDFHSRRLKNTPEELQTQDRVLRDTLVDACRRGGLAVAGYSGRDHSVMDALDDGVGDGEGYPLGHFWFHRGPGAPAPRVRRLVERAHAVGIDAHVIPLDTFDELLGDLWHQIENVPPDLAALFDHRRRRLSDVPLPPTNGGFPVIRLNAVPLRQIPAVCRLVACGVGDTREVRDAVELAGVPLLTARRRAGVIAFGRDEDARAALGPHEITRFDLHAIEPRRLAYDSSEHGLIRDALVAALTRERPVVSRGRRRDRPLLVANPAGSRPELLERLTRAAGTLGGFVPRVRGTPLPWAEAMRFRLDYRLGRTWLLVEPTIWIGDTDQEDARSLGADFRRERLAARRNRGVNDVLDAWVALLAAGQPEASVRAFGFDGGGIDAVFTLLGATAYSRREGADRRPGSRTSGRGDHRPESDPRPAGAGGRP